mmetsp:Transcript_43899/g.73104  ORF Transcript_43899/g.73104 Transcript_43899/m.73104 type:complete len:353 (+) Transcript_43899:132-1190(+)
MLTSSHPIIGVFDGHGCLGHSAAQLCKRVLPLVLSSVLVKDDTPEDAAITAFGETQELLLRMAFSEQKEYDRLQKRWLAFQSGDKQQDGDSGRAEEEGNLFSKNLPVCMDYGTTATLCFLSNNGKQLCIAHAGDSRCLVVKRKMNIKRDQKEPVDTSSSSSSSSVSGLPSSPKWELVYSSLDHNCYDDHEMESVVKRGGIVSSKQGDIRVYPRSMAKADAGERGLSLNMTRSLGHIVLSKEAGISPLPDIKLLDIDRSCEYLVIAASDGLWDFMPESDVIKGLNGMPMPMLVPTTAHEVSAQPRRRSMRSGAKRGGPLEQLVSKLMKSAMAAMERRFGGDNVTVAVLHLNSR